MNGDLIFRMLLGHLFGDYFLQNNYLALNKNKYNNIGFVTCFIHCLFYTLSICIFMFNFNIYWILAIFINHFIIDKFGIAELYLKLIKGRSIKKITKNNIEAGFNVFVYITIDNGLHLILMYFTYKFIF